MKYKYTFPEILGSIRREKKLTLERLGEELNVNSQTIGKWERGYSIPTIDYVFLIAEIFDTDIEYLLTGEVKEKPEEPKEEPKKEEEKPDHRRHIYKKLKRCLASNNETATINLKREDIWLILKALEAFIND